LLWLRLSHRFHRDAQQFRDEMIKRRRPLQLADRQMGMGRAAEIEISNAFRCFPPPSPMESSFAATRKYANIQYG
jgi:hypothetical protein